MIPCTTIRTYSPYGVVALVFDLDGVIVNSNPLHSACWREYLLRQGVEVPEGFDQSMWGRRNDQIVRQVFGPDLETGEVFRHGAEKEKLYRETIGPVLAEHMVAGAVSFIRRHRSRPMAVATNAEPANAAFILDRGGLRPYIAVVVDGAQVAHPKPDPEIYLKAAERLGVAPADCIVFEDSKAGVEAARAAGARVVLIETTHTASELPPVELSIRDFLDPALEPWVSAQKPAR
jgi:beta-phosphoglucomutase